VIWIVVSEILKSKNNVIFKGGVIDVSERFILPQLKVWSWVTSKEFLVFFFLILTGVLIIWFVRGWLSDVLDCWLVSLLLFFCGVCRSFVSCW